VLPAEAVAAQLNFHGASFNGVGPINVMGSTLDLTTVLGCPEARMDGESSAGMVIVWNGHTKPTKLVSLTPSAEAKAGGTMQALQGGMLAIGAPSETL